MFKKIKRSIKKSIKSSIDATNSSIWINLYDAGYLYMVLHYNGIRIGEIIQEQDDVVKVTFLASRNQRRKIEKDISGFNINYIGANWAV